VGDASSVRHIENGQDPLQKPDDFVLGPGQPLALVLLKNGVEGRAVEPLENHVGHPLPSRRRVFADVSGLHDARGLAR